MSAADPHHEEGPAESSDDDLTGRRRQPQAEWETPPAPPLEMYTPDVDISASPALTRESQEAQRPFPSGDGADNPAELAPPAEDGPPMIGQEMEYPDDDFAVPLRSDFRSLVLGFLSVDDKMVCSLANERWYDAGCRWSSWESDFGLDPLLGLCAPAVSGGCVVRHVHQDPSAVFVPSCNAQLAAKAAVGLTAAEKREANELGGLLVSSTSPVLKHGLDASLADEDDGDRLSHYYPRSSFGVRMEFESPLMYASVLHFARNRAARIRALLPPLDSPFRSCMQVLPAFFGSVARRSEQYELAHILLRHPTFLSLPDIWTVAPGYGSLPPYLIIIAHLTQWYMLRPTVNDLRWLISLGQWAANATDPRRGGRALPFHKLLIAPLLAVASHPTCRLRRVYQFTAITDCVFRLAHRYLGEAMSQDAAARARQRFTALEALRANDAPPPPPYVRTEVLPDHDPRLIFSVLHHLSVQYPKMAPILEEHITNELGDYGHAELAAARRRVSAIERLRDASPLRASEQYVVGDGDDEHGSGADDC